MKGMRGRNGAVLLGEEVINFKSKDKEMPFGNRMSNSKGSWLKN